MNENLKKAIEDAKNLSDEQKSEKDRVNAIKSENRRKNDLAKSIYKDLIEKHLEKFIDEFNENHKKNGGTGYIAFPGINFGPLNNFYHWISLLNGKRINININSLMSNDEMDFRKLDIEIGNERKSIVGYGTIQYDNGTGYNLVLTNDGEKNEVFLLENIDHAKPIFNKISKPFGFDEIDLRIKRIKIQSDINTAIVSDLNEILDKIEKLITENNLTK